MKLLSKMKSKRSQADEYWELEGLCKIENAPQVMAAGGFGGPVFVLAPRKYCIRR